MPLDHTKYRRAESSLERFNEQKPQKPRQEIPQEWWADLDEINGGGVLEYEANDRDDANTLRRTLGRYAASYLGKKLDFSGSGTTVIVKLSEEPLVRKTKKRSGEPAAA